LLPFILWIKTLSYINTMVFLIEKGIHTKEGDIPFFYLFLFKRVGILWLTKL